MKEREILAGCYRGWSTKTPGEKAKAYQEEAGDDYWAVKGELRRIYGAAAEARESGSETRETPEEMVRTLQNIFCQGRYRSWRPGRKTRRLTVR